jgi:putative transcriptional regulator
MNRKTLAATVLCAVLAWSAMAQAQTTLAEPVLLIAQRDFNDRFYYGTILLVTPLGEDRHVGFIVNRPTPMTLGKIFPEHGPSRKIADPIYLGGPYNTNIVYAVVQRAGSPGTGSMQLTPDLFLALSGETVDRIIEAEADHARFFTGMVLWSPGELRAEVKQGFWHLRAPDTQLVLRQPTDGLWEELVGSAERAAKSI